MAFTNNLTTMAQAAARFAGIMDSGEALSAQQLSDALEGMNDKLDDYSAEGLFALSDLVTPAIPLVAGTQSYTIGAAQTINIARPVKINAAAFANASGFGGDLKVVDEKTWAGIEDRQRQSNRLEVLFYDRGFPTGKIYLSPVPLSANPTLELHSWVPLTQFADTTTTITIPPGGYDEFLKLSLAIVMCPQFNRSIPASVLSSFQDVAQRVRKMNASLLGEIPPELLAEARGAA